MYECNAMIMFFQRADIALAGLGLYYKVLASHLYGFAQKLMDYQTVRGGYVVFMDIKAPKQTLQTDNSPMQSFEQVLARFKHFSDEVNKVFVCGQRNNDPHLQNFVQHQLIKQTHEMVYLISETITRLKRAGNLLSFRKKKISRLK